MRPRNPQRLEPEFEVLKNIKRKTIPYSDTWKGPNGYEQFKKDVGLKPSPTASLRRKNRNEDWIPGNTFWYDINMDKPKLEDLDPNLTIAERMAKLKEYGLRTGTLVEVEETPTQGADDDPFGQFLDLSES